MRETLAQQLDRVIFAAALGLIGLTAVPYGSVEPWASATFECAAFALCALWMVEGGLRGEWRVGGIRLLAPVAALGCYALLQTIQTGSGEWQSISADPFETRMFASRLFALVALGAVLFAHVTTARRLRALVTAVALTALASAAFGLVRQASQGEVEGFVLAHLSPGLGYGQFINQNHFALLMEMALGLLLGVVVGGGARRERLPLWLAAAVPVWAALVLTYSRGAVLSMCVMLTLLLLNCRRVREPRPQPSTGRAAAGRALLGACALAFAFVGAAWLGGGALLGRMEAIPAEVRAEGAEGRAGVRRVEVWGATLRLWKEDATLGTGLGAYPTAITRTHDASGRWTPEAAHNDYLELLAGAGLPGLICGAWFVFVLAAGARRRLFDGDPFCRAACYGSLLGLAGVAVHSLFDYGLHITANACVFAALTVAATAETEEARAVARKPERLPNNTPSRRRGLQALTACVCLLLCVGLAWGGARAGFARESADAAARNGDEIGAARAVSLSPSDPYVAELRAGVLADMGHDTEAAEAFEQAARLRPRDYFLWLELARTRDLAGDESGALAAAERALSLAPFYAQPRWLLGNLLLRRGDSDRGFATINSAIESDPALTSAAADLAWGAADGDAREVLRLLPPRNDSARLSLAQFLLDHGETDESLRLVRAAAPRAAAEARAAAARLLANGMYCAAREVWSAAERGEAPCDSMLDGGFEGAVFETAEGFGWKPFRGSQTFQLGADDGAARAGARSLVIEFAGASDPAAPLLSQTVPVMPRTRYRLGFSVRAEDLLTGGSPFVSVRESAPDGRELAGSAKLGQGTFGWRDDSLTFETGGDARAVAVVILRRSCERAPCPAYGRVWFDEFRLERIPAADIARR